MTLEAIATNQVSCKMIQLSKDSTGEQMVLELACQNRARLIDLGPIVTDLSMLGLPVNQLSLFAGLVLLRFSRLLIACSHDS